MPLAPLRFPPDMRLTPVQFARLCAENREAVLELASEQRRGFAPLSPDLVVELASPSDEGPRGLTALRSKMAAY